MIDDSTFAEKLEWLEMLHCFSITIANNLCVKKHSEIKNLHTVLCISIIKERSLRVLLNVYDDDDGELIGRTLSSVQFGSARFSC